MLNKNTFKTKQHQAGVTIVELMISIVLGLLLLSAATAMTVKSMVMNGDTLASAKLNQDLDSVLHVMVNDIRRAGYTGETATTPGVVFAPNDDLYIAAQKNCVLYAYDANADGVLADSEKFGFKLVRNDGLFIQMRTSCAAGSTCATDCSTGTWSPLTDPTMTTITSLNFDSQFSKCISITATANKSATNNNNYWVMSANNESEFPCLAPSGSAANLSNYYLNASGNYQTGTFVPGATGDRLVEARQVNVELAGRKTSDASMIKSQKVGINVRNNHIYTVP